MVEMVMSPFLNPSCQNVLEICIGGFNTHFQQKKIIEKKIKFFSILTFSSRIRQKIFLPWGQSDYVGLLPRPTCCNIFPVPTSVTKDGESLLAL